MLHLGHDLSPSLLPDMRVLHPTDNYGDSDSTGGGHSHDVLLP